MQSTRTVRVRRCLTEILDRWRKIPDNSPQKIVRRFHCSSAEIQLFDEVRVERMRTWTLIKSLQRKSVDLSGAGGLDEDLCERTAPDGWFVLRDDLFDHLGGNFIAMKDLVVEQKKEIEILLALRHDLYEFEQYCLTLCQRELMEQHQEDLQMFSSQLVRTLTEALQETCPERENQLGILSFENDLQEKNECVQRNLHWPRLIRGQSEFGEKKILHGFTEDVMLNKIVNQSGHHRSMFNQIGDALELFFDVQRRFEILDGRGLIVDFGIVALLVFSSHRTDCPD